MVKKLKDITPKFYLVSFLYFDIISDRLVVNTAIILIYNIEKIWRRRKALIKLAFDIKSVFEEFVEKKLTY